MLVVKQFHCILRRLVTVDPIVDIVPNSTIRRHDVLLKPESDVCKEVFPKGHPESLLQNLVHFTTEYGHLFHNRQNKSISDTCKGNEVLHEFVQQAFGQAHLSLPGLLVHDLQVHSFPYMDESRTSCGYLLMSLQCSLAMESRKRR